jgi:LEA14-like dessication related protein
MAAAALGAVQKPTLTYRSMDVAYIGAEGFTFNLNLEIHNPNAYSIPLGETTYSLKFGDVPILQGRARPVGAVPPNSSLLLTLPISLTWQNVLGAEEVIRRNRGDIPYTLEGRLGFDVDVPQLLIFHKPLRVPLRYSGVVPVRELLKNPSLLLRSPAMARLAQIAVGYVFSQQTQPAPVPRRAPPARQESPLPE